MKHQSKIEIILSEVDEVLLEYIERVEKAEKLAMLCHGRSLALAVKVALAMIRDGKIQIIDK